MTGGGERVDGWQPSGCWHACRWRAACVLVLAAVLLPGCAPERTAAPATTTPGLRTVTLPDLAGSDASVRHEARERYEALLTAQKTKRQPVQLAAAYGSLGMFLHAAESLDAAVPCYENAELLNPRNAEWPYYLGLIHSSAGRTGAAIAAFTRTLAIDPGDLPALIRLARLHIDAGNPEAAEPLLKTARERAPLSVAVLAALGQAALAQRRYDVAARLFEEALAIDMGAASLHGPLATAYRALGRQELADDHAKMWRNRDLTFPDPRRERLDAEVQSGLTYEMRGLEALRAREWPSAIAAFREGLEVARADSVAARSLRHKLGTALYLSGDVAGAMSEFTTVLRAVPDGGDDEWTAKAHYSLGVLMVSAGLFPKAIAHFRAAVAIQPHYAEAHLALADVLRRTRAFDGAVRHYAELSRIVPANVDAAVGQAIALVALRRYGDAREVLNGALVSQPGHPQLTVALARVLAASPDAGVRDGRRALEMMQKLAATVQTTDVGEVLAMALAETGNYADAVRVQQDVLVAATSAGLTDVVPILQANLRRYQQQRPCRTPWDARDPMHEPGPPVNRELAAVVRAAAEQP